MLVGLMLSVAWADGWTESTKSDGCTFYIGPRQGEFSPVRAVCDWDIPAATLQGVVSKLDAHDDYFSSVARAEKLPDGRYRQVHQASGISDREVILDMGATPIDGGMRYWWKKASDQSALTGSNVEAIVDTGKWEVSDNGRGGSAVVYELMYDPGGSVPGFLVRWFQTSGTQELVKQLYVAAGGH